MIVSNQEIANLFGNNLLDNLKKNNFSAKIFIIKPGETHKNIETMNEIYDAAFEYGMERG